MFEWPWMQSEKETTRIVLASEAKLNNRISIAEDQFKVEVENLSSKLISVMSDLEDSLKKERESVSSRINVLENNTSSIHKYVSDQSRIIVSLREKVAILQEGVAEEKFFLDIKPTISERLARTRGKISSLFSRHHFLIISNLFFILSTAALAWLVISNL